MATKKRATAARRKPTAKPAETVTIDQQLVSDVTLETLLKAVSHTLLATGTTQASQISDQIAQQVSNQVAQQVSKQISEVQGKLQSDFATRTASTTTTDRNEDVDSVERMKATAAREDALMGYKSNTTDYLLGLNAVANQGSSQSQLTRMIEATVNHYATSLGDERIQKARILSGNERHTDIAVEKQWVTTQKNLSDAIVGEVVKTLRADEAARKAAGGK